MARRGFLAELQHQARVAARDRERAQLAAVREHNSAIRRAEQARRAAERAQAQYARAAEAESKRLEKEAREAHVASMEAEADRKNLELEALYADLDSLLASTLGVDDFVDLETLRVRAEHPPFDRRDLEVPIQLPDSIPDPKQPAFKAPEPPKGIAKLMGGKKRHARAIAAAQERHDQTIAFWRRSLHEVALERQEAMDAHAASEAQRMAALERERARYERECAAREAEAARRNRELDQLIANLGYGTVEAVQEYVSIVLSNSVYPEHFPVEYESRFEPTTAELSLRALVPDPDQVPGVKSYKYAKSSDDIVATQLPAKECRERYARSVHQVAVRCLHEVFEADRRGLVKTISLQVGTQTIDRATGLQVYVPFVAVGAERGAFLGFDLAGVVPLETLKHLGAAISKNPHGLVATDVSGVRGP